MCSEDIYEEKVISRKEAKELGLKFYFTGKPCKHGHIELRHTGNGDCKKCREQLSKSQKKKEYRRKYHIENRTSQLEYMKEYRNSNKEMISQAKKDCYNRNREAYLRRCKEWYQRNREHCKARNALYYQRNKKRALYIRRKWIESNPGKVTLYSSRRKAAKLQRTLNLSEQHQDDIKHIYEQAALLRYLGYDVHVDHIIPLRGETVSGLHVPWNLQIIPAEENLRKNNNLLPEHEIEVYS